MTEATVVVNLHSGLHARPAATLVQLANRFLCEIFLVKDGKSVNAKSILGVMSLAATKGSEITVQANGVDEQKAVEELTEFLSHDEN